MKTITFFIAVIQLLSFYPTSVKSDIPPEVSQALALVLGGGSGGQTAAKTSNSFNLASLVRNLRDGQDQ